MTNKQASSRNCFVCGVKNVYGLHLSFYEVGPGEIEAELVVPEHFQGYPGVVHGGVVAAILDEVSGRAFMGDQEPRFMVTAKLTIRYRHPVPIGKQIFLKGHAREDKGRIAMATGEIFDADGTLLAEVETVLADAPSEVAMGFVPGEEEWKVYPDQEQGK